MTMSKYRTYLIFGAPGSGKGTQGRTLGTLPCFFHEYSSKGQLVPDEITVELWRVRIQDFVSSHQFKPDLDYLLLNGIPRSIRQAELMDPFIDVQKIFHLSCPHRGKLVERLKKRAIRDNRFDDANEEVIRKRLDTYRRESKPLLDYYGDGLTVEIDATRPPVVVLDTVVSQIVSGRSAEAHFTESNKTRSSEGSPTIHLQDQKSQ
jgi:adenylate kinase